MSGEATPRDPYQQHSCTGLRLMQENMTLLGDLQERQQRLMSEALQLQQDMLDFKVTFRKDVQDVLERTPLELKPRKAKVDIDAENAEAENLPPPLLPQVVCQVAGSSQSWWDDLTLIVCQVADTQHTHTPHRSDAHDDDKSSGDTSGPDSTTPSTGLDSSISAASPVPSEGTHSTCSDTPVSPQCSSDVIYLEDEVPSADCSDSSDHIIDHMRSLQIDDEESSDISNDQLFVNSTDEHEANQVDENPLKANDVNVHLNGASEMGLTPLNWLQFNRTYCPGGHRWELLNWFSLF